VFVLENPSKSIEAVKQGEEDEFRIIREERREARRLELEEERLTRRKERRERKERNRAEAYQRKLAEQRNKRRIEKLTLMPVEVREFIPVPIRTDYPPHLSFRPLELWQKRENAYWYIKKGFTLDQVLEKSGLSEGEMFDFLRLLKKNKSFYSGLLKLWEKTR